MKAFILLFFPAVFCASMSAQTTSGTIVYSHSEKIDPSRMRVITINRGAAGDDVTHAMPTTVDDERTLIFGGGFGKFKGGRGSGMVRISMDGSGKREKKEEIKIRPPFDSRTFFNMNKGSKIQLMTIRDDEKGTEEAFFTETPFVTPENMDYSDKTKEIAGFKCKKATLKEKDGKVTIWYTTEIPYTFSPVEKYTPKEGFVLELEADEVYYKAEKYENTPVKAEDLILPGGAQKVTREVFDSKRKEAMEKFRPFKNN